MTTNDRAGRDRILTMLAVRMSLMAISNVAKPFGQAMDPGVGAVLGELSAERAEVDVMIVQVLARGAHRHPDISRVSRRGQRTRKRTDRRLLLRLLVLRRVAARGSDVARKRPHRPPPRCCEPLLLRLRRRYADEQPRLRPRDLAPLEGGTDERELLPRERLATASTPFTVACGRTTPTAGCYGDAR